MIKVVSLLILFNSVLLSQNLHCVKTKSKNLAEEKINIYFNFSVDTTVAIPGNTAKGNIDFREKLIERINSATYSIDMALYSFFGMQEVADALILAKNRGVKIRVVYDHRDGNPLQNSMQALADAGILISRRPLRSSAFPGIMHNKFIIFDARDTVSTNDWIWTGSWNVTSTELGWKNNVVEINDSGIASAYVIEFEEMWGSSLDVPDPSTASFGMYKTNNTPHNFTVGGINLQLYFSPSDETTSKIIEQINSADHNIFLAQYVFTRNDISDAIVDRTNLGMNDLRGVIDQVSATGSEFTFLQNYGEMFANPSPVLHHKYGIIDASYSDSDPVIITGSHNWSSAAENDNDENTLIIKDVYIANQYMQEFKKRYNEAGGTGIFIIPVGVENENSTIPKFSYKLYQNYPNPFNPVTTIRFEIPSEQNINLSLFDMLGRQVQTLFDGLAPAGIMSIDFTADGIAAGIYIYRVITKHFVDSKKLILIK